MSNAGSRLLFRFSRKTLVLAICVLFPCCLNAAATVASQFPEPQRVLADYNNDAERYAALKVLYDALDRATKGSGERDAYPKSSAYFQSFSLVADKYSTRAGVKPAGADEFSRRASQLMTDRAFAAAVIDRYKVGKAIADGEAQIAKRERARTGGPTDAEIRSAFIAALPIVVVTLLVMAWLARTLIDKGKPFSESALPAASSTLPVDLRVVEVPDLRYPIDHAYGLVLDKETTIGHHVTTTTTGGQPYTVLGETYTTPVQTSTSVSTTQTELIWIRTRDGKETSWTLTNSSFRTRPGHVISAIIRGIGGGPFMMLFNHTTGQLVHLDLYGGHGTGSGWAWKAAALAGTAGFAVAIHNILSIDPPEGWSDGPMGPAMGWIVTAIMGAIISAIAAVWVVSRARAKVFNRRKQYFDAQVLPKLTAFLKNFSPAL